MDATYSFGEWLKRRRKTAGLTQRELAEHAHCSTVTIKKIEADQRRPSAELAELLARSLSFPDDQIEIFIECARGRRPVDHLERESGARTSESNAALLRAAEMEPLPVISTPLIGRETELAMLQRLLAETWLVTIAGVGGIGKTRLAARRADNRFCFPGGLEAGRRSGRGDCRIPALTIVGRV